MKCFTEVYKREDFEHVITFRTKGNFHPWQISKPRVNNVSEVYCFEAKIDNKRKYIDMIINELKVQFALEVWQFAANETLKKFSDYLNHNWININRHPIKRLKFTSPNRENGDKFFYSKIKEACSLIRVSEGYTLSTKNSSYSENILNVVVDEDEIDSEIQDKICRQFKKKNKKYYSFNKKNVQYSFEDIKYYFVHSDNHILELINAEEGIEQVSEIDNKFIETANSFDIDQAVNYLHEGADINAINKMGETAITTAAENANQEFLFAVKDWNARWDKNPELIEINKKAIPYINELLKRGADINMVGYEGWTALTYAILPGNHILLEYLLKNGANPNITLDPYQTYTFEYSYALVELENYLMIGGNEYVFEIMGNLLSDAGAVERK